MLVAYCRLCCHCRNLAKGGFFLSQFHFTRCHHFLGHVACRNLPWQGPLLCSFLRLKELFQVKNGGYAVTFFLLKMQKFWVGRVTLNGEWGMEWSGTTLCYFLMHFVCSNINIIPFLFSTAGPSIGTKRSFCVPLRNSPLWEEDTCIVFIV